MRAAVLVLLLAGCLAPADPTTPLDEPDAALAALAALARDLPCEADVAEGTSANLLEVGASPLDSAGYASVGELAFHGRHAYVARYGTGGVSVVDVADPREPIEVGVWDPDAGEVGQDVKTLADGTAVLVAGDHNVFVVDVRDPTNPALESVYNFTETEAHMLAPFVVDGREWVAVTRASREDLQILEVRGGPGRHELALAASPTLTPPSRLTDRFSPIDVTRPHDAFFFDDPLLEKPTLWLANVWWGVVVLDVSDPTRPALLAERPDVGPPYYTHTVQAVVVDGKRYVASVSELGASELRFYDWTDLAAPRLLATWDVGNRALPQHNIQMVWPYLYVAHYEQGTFVFDLRDGVNGALAPIARLAPEAEERATGGPGLGTAFGASFGGVWDVGLRDGLLYTTNAGLRVAAFGCLQPGDAAVRSIG